jgi:hypothetical protein
MTDSIEYKLSGIQRLLRYKPVFDPVLVNDPGRVSEFVNLFCEYQLADNNYMNIHLEAVQQKNNDEWFASLGFDQVLKFLTYIIWTDKFLDGYLAANIKDKTIFRLLSRLEQLSSASILPATGK